MTKAAHRLAPAFVAAVILLVTPISRAHAEHFERRDYTVLVDGKAAGQTHLAIRVKDDGTTEVEGQGQVYVKLLGFNAYSYEVKSSETWKDGLLVKMDVVAVENGKKTKVAVAPSAGQLRMTINGNNANNLRPDIWPSSYWKLADKKFHNNSVPILDADTGTVLSGKLEFIDFEKIDAKGADFYHFRITGIPVPIDLWFDRYHRLVRQQFTESGHKTIIRLDSVR